MFPHVSYICVSLWSWHTDRHHDLPIVVRAHNCLGISSYWYLGCWFNSLFRLRQGDHQSSTLLPPCEGNSPVVGGFTYQKYSNTVTISMAWRHQVERQKTSNPDNAETWFQLYVMAFPMTFWNEHPRDFYGNALDIYSLSATIVCHRIPLDSLYKGSVMCAFVGFFVKLIKLLNNNRGHCDLRCSHSVAGMTFEW